jgi:hypothetical protein
MPPDLTSSHEHRYRRGDNGAARTVRVISRALDTVCNTAVPLVDLYRPYVDGLENLPRDGRFLVVGNHTQSGIQGLLIPHFVRRAIGTRVCPLTDRMFRQMPRPVRDLPSAYGAVVGSPDNARELMRHNESYSGVSGRRPRNCQVQGRGIHPSMGWARRLRAPLRRERLSDCAGGARRRR